MNASIKKGNTYPNVHIYTITAKEDKELDLIDGISFGYAKGSESHFAIHYTVFPSEKFNNHFQQWYIYVFLAFLSLSFEREDFRWYIHYSIGIS